MLPRHRTIGFTTEVAAIFKSSVFSEVRGSVGGTTYARNKSGLYARNRSKPVNPNTPKQSTVRSQFGTNSFGYGDLNVSQIASWNQFAQGYPAINKVGDTYTPSGRQMYMMCNQNLASIGIAPIAVPPYAIPVVPDVDMTGVVGTIVLDAGPPITIDTFSVQLPTSSAPDANLVLQATPNMQASRQSYRNRMRQVATGGSGDGEDIAAAFNEYFGTPSVTPGQIVNLRVACVIPASGVSSAWFYFQAVVPAVGP